MRAFITTSIIICVIAGCPGRQQATNNSSIPNVVIQYNDIKGHEVLISLLTTSAVDSVDLAGLATFHLKKGRKKIDFGHGYIDLSLYSGFPKRIKAVRDTTIYPIFTEVPEGTFLSFDNPVYFADMDLDGEDEIVIVRKDWAWDGGAKFQVFEMDGAERKDMPLYNIDDNTRFDVQAGTITLVYSHGYFGGTKENTYKHIGGGIYVLSKTIETELYL